MTRYLKTLLPALVGGAIAAGLVLLVDDDGGKTTTVIQQAPLAADLAADSDAGPGLTAREIYRRDAPGVVFIRATVVQRTESPFELFPTEQRGESTGSGFVVDDDGFILTNAHVVDGATEVSVAFSDERRRSARIVGRDTSTDLALLKVDPDGLELKPLRLGDSNGVRVGDPTVAIGNPFGLDRTLTTGVVSALQREIEAPDGFRISNVIQTDAAINPGNSGGPLIDAAGRVIGVNSQIATGGSGRGNVGIAFAVPINTAKRVIPQLKDKGRVERAYAGISGLDIDGSLEDLNLPVDRGVLVQEVTPGSPADEAGVRAGETPATLDGRDILLGGDIIVGIDGRGARSMDDVVTTVTRKKPGDELELELLRRGKRIKVTLDLVRRPQQPPQR